MDESFTFGKGNVQARRDIIGEKNLERSALKAFQKRETFQRLARDTGEARTRKNESHCP